MNRKFQVIGQYLQMLRKSKKWTQQDVAEYLNITNAAVSKIEAGFVDMGLSRLEQFGSLYNISIVEIIINQQLPGVDHADKLAGLNERLRIKDIETLHLQNRLIDLYEKLHALNKPK